MSVHRRRSAPESLHLAAVAVLAWVAMEVALRWGSALAAGRLIDAPLFGDYLSLLLGLPVVAAVIARYATAAGLHREDWGYEFGRRALLAGVLAAVVGVALTAVTRTVDAALFDAGDVAAGFGAALGDVGVPFALFAAVLLLGNGIVAPVAEELVWRGVVQTELVERWGAVAGIGATAVLFAGKHVVVDLAAFRTTTLLGLGLLFGVVKYRWGTAASTVTHALLNLLGTAGLLWMAL